MSVRHEPRRMIGPFTRKRAHMTLAHTAFAALMLTMLPLHSSAQQTQPIETATDIKAQPLALLAKYPEAGPAMARFVAQQLTQQPAAVDAMLSVLNDMSPEQASATGAGMVRAARALSAKHPASAKAITDKVMHSDNKWLKTTYSSLGPRYRGSANFTAYADLPPRQGLATGDMGSGLGASWRVGPAPDSNRTGIVGVQNGDDVAQTCLYDTNGYADPHCRGMIVAIIKSDAGHNGAVSTSPTI